MQYTSIFFPKKTVGKFFSTLNLPLSPVIA